MKKNKIKQIMLVLVIYSCSIYNKDEEIMNIHLNINFHHYFQNLYLCKNFYNLYKNSRLGNHFQNLHKNH